MENSKKIFISIFILLPLISISCNFQNIKDNNKVNINKEMEQTKKETHNVFKDYQPARQLNINKFNANSEKNHYHFIDDNGMEVHQFADAEFPSGKINKYWEKRKYPNSAYEFYSEYDAKGLLMKTLTSFYTAEIGVMCFYDVSGNITQKENLDAPYKFSLDDLIDKMKDEYEIDILTPNLIWDVNRYVVDKENMPFYEVKVRDLVRIGIIHVYFIDGNTGETLLITTRETEWSGQPSERVLDEYIRKKANGEL